MMRPKDFVTDKIKAIPYSGIRNFFDVASEMEGVVSLGVGEPDFDTPWNIRDHPEILLTRMRKNHLFLKRWAFIAKCKYLTTCITDLIFFMNQRIKYW